MKLNAIGAVLVRLSSVGFLLKGVTGLVQVAWLYSKLHRAVESNAALKQGLHDTLKNGALTALVALAVGAVAWLFSRPLGRWLAGGLEESHAAASGAS
jgi:uncharacterized membrane protein